MSPGDFYLNLCATFPDAIKKRHRRAERKKAEARLGYNPVRRLIEALKSGLSPSAFQEFVKIFKRLIVAAVIAPRFYDEDAMPAREDAVGVEELAEADFCHLVQEIAAWAWP